MSNIARRKHLIIAALALTTAAGGLSPFASSSHASAPPPAVSAAISVRVQTLKLQDVGVWSGFSGRLTGTNPDPLR